MICKLSLLSLVLVCLAALSQPGCFHDDDDDGASPDDDTTDDDTTDDDTNDDDTTDDDTTDDDTADDDTADDDTADDDTTDDDTTDDDTADDDLTDDPYVVTGVYGADLYASGHVPAPTEDATVTHIAGGAFGHYGVGLAVGAQLPSEMEQLVAENVLLQATAKDENGHLYVAYVTHADDGVWVANNTSGSWSVQQATTQTGVQTLDLAVAGGQVHIGYIRYDGDGSYVHYLTDAGGAWVDEPLDDYAQNVSIVAAAQGAVHILYNRCYSYSQLKYRTNAAGSWTTTVIGSANWWFIDFDMFLDAQGALHVAALDAIYGMVQEHFIYYGRKGSGDWSFALAFHHYGMDYFITTLALLVDGGGTPHIAFASGGFYYLTPTAERAWTLTELFDGETVNELQSDRGGADRLYFAYFNQSRGRAEVMARRGGAWERLPAESGGYVLANVDLAIDSQGHRHAVYYDCASDAWLYATDASGQWVSETLCAEVGGDPSYSSTPSLAMDENGAAHVAFYRAANESLLYATNASGAWITEAVESGGMAGYASSLAVDGEGRVHLAYEAPSKGGLIYAVRDGDWTKTTVGDGGAYVDPASLVLDDEGNAHIAYLYDSDQNGDYDEQVRYATDAAGEWNVQTVYAAPAVTIVDVALALDDDGHARVAFPVWDYPDDSLFVASNAGGSWEAVDALGGVDSNYIYDVDIAIDAAGHTHVLTGDLCSGEMCERLAHLTDAGGEWAADYPPIAGTAGNSVALAPSDAGLEAVYTGEFALWHLLLPW